jgi:U3 small nucleolar RNA-associated protein 13
MVERSNARHSKEEDDPIVKYDPREDDEGDANDVPEDDHDAAMEGPMETTSRLSKSWTMKSVHGPLYTGGKIVVIPPDTVLQNQTSVIVTQVLGDVCFTDLSTDERLCNLQELENGDNPIVSEDSDYNDNVTNNKYDRNAITAYGITDNYTAMMTCTQSNLLRFYTILPMDRKAQESELSSKKQISLQKRWSQRSGHSLPVTDIQFHSSHALAATAAVDGTVRVWDVRNPQQSAFVTHVFRPAASSSSGTVGAVTCLAWMPPAQLVVGIGRDDGSICLHDLRQEAAVVVLRDHMSAVTGMAWDVAHQLCLTAGRDAVMHVWKYEDPVVSEPQSKSRSKKKQTNSETTKYTRVHTCPVYEQVEGMVLLQLPNDTWNDDEDAAVLTTVATAGTKGQIRFWNVVGSKQPSAVQVKVCATLQQPKQSMFGETRGGYASLQLLRDPISSTTNNLTDPSARLPQMLVTDAEQNVNIFSLARDGASTIQPMAGLPLALRTERMIVGYNDEILDLKVIPTHPNEPERMVVATNSTQIRIYGIHSFTCHAVLEEYHSATILGVDVSPCGRYIATCSKDKSMRLWHASATQKSLAVAMGHTEAVGSTALSRKVNRYDIAGKAAANGAGAFAVTVSIDRTLKRWNLPGALEMDRIANLVEAKELALSVFCSTQAHEKDINVVAVAPNDSLIATGSQDKTVKLFKAADLTLVTTLKGHRRGVWDVSFSPYDRVVATGSGDKTIKLWSLNDYSCVRTFQGHLASVLRVRFLTSGLQLVSSGADGLVKLWTVRTNESEATMDAHTDRVWALDLANNGKEMISGGADSQIVLWQDSTKEVEDVKMAEEQEAILVDQKLANHLRRKEYGEALEISLERDKPHHTLKVLNAIIDTDLQTGLPGIASIKRYIKGWNMDRIVRILGYCREWNTRARNSHVALLTINAIVSTIPVHTLAATPGIPELIAGIIPYTERHFDRLDQLHASSYLFDFALSSMGVIEPLYNDTSNSQEYASWEMKSKLVLPPRKFDGRVDVGGKIIVGAPNHWNHAEADSDDDNESNELITIGDSEESEEE